MVRKIGILMIAVVVLASCGKQKEQSLSVDTAFDAHALAAAADHTAGATTGKAHLTVTMGSAAATETSTTSGPLSFSISGDGSFDIASGLASMNLDHGVEVIQHGPVVYLRGSMLSKLDPAVGDKWIKLDGSRMGAAGQLGSTGQLAGSSGIGDPSAVLDYLKGAGADVTTVGHEAIDGVDTTHVHATLSMKQALDSAGAGRARVERSLENMPGGVAGSIESLTLPVDVYIDADGYVRRIAVQVDLSGLLEKLGSLTVTVDYRDLGQPVTITEPTADQTVSVCDLQAHLPGTTKTRPTLPDGVC